MIVEMLQRYLSKNPIIFKGPVEGRWGNYKILVEMKNNELSIRTERVVDKYKT